MEPAHLPHPPSGNAGARPASDRPEHRHRRAVHPREPPPSPSSTSSSSTPSSTATPATLTSIDCVYDSDFCGLADDGGGDGNDAVLCKCGFLAKKFVSFERYNTGRRFLACEGHEEGLKCSFLQWVDDVCPDAMNKAVAKLWVTITETRQGRTEDAFDFMQQKFNLQDEVKKLHIDLRNSQAEVAKEMGEKQVILADKAKAEQALMEARAELEEKRITDATTCKMHKCLLISAQKEREKLKEEKRKLEFAISDLMNQKEKYKARFKKIKELSDIVDGPPM